MPRSEEHVTISTTFTGEHAELIRKIEQEFQTNKPTALRLFLSRYLQGLLISLNPATKERIDNIINNPILTKQFGFSSTESFIDFAINFTLNAVQNALSDLRDPAIQVILEKEEQEVARLLLKTRDEHYGGLTVDQIAQFAEIPKNFVQRILKDFIAKGWAQQKGEKYLLGTKLVLSSSF